MEWRELPPAVFYKRKAPFKKGAFFAPLVKGERATKWQGDS